MKIDSSAVAAVTGAASGIGRALALELARRGAALALADVNKAGLRETVAAIPGVKVSSHLVDVSDPAQVEAFAAAVKAAHGRATLLVNNAGVALGRSFDQVSLPGFAGRHALAPGHQLRGSGLRLQVLLSRQESRGHIVNVSSVYGLFAPPGQTAYAAAKFAVRGSRSHCGTSSRAVRSAYRWCIRAGSKPTSPAAPGPGPISRPRAPRQRPN